MPQMGESVTEGTVLEWRKQVGDRVEAEEPLVEISTDKVDAEVPAPAAGTLAKILAEPDSLVQVGAVLGEIETGDAPPAEEDESPPAPTRTGPAPASSWTSPFPRWAIRWPRGPCSTGGSGRATRWPSTTPSWRSPPTRWTPRYRHRWPGRWRRSSPSPTRRFPWARSCAGSPRAPARRRASGNGPVQPKAEPAAKPVEESAPASGNGGNATPVAARMASAHGLDLDAIRGSGPRGRVTKEDVLAAVEGNGGAAAPAAPPAKPTPPPSAAPRPRSCAS